MPAALLSSAIELIRSDGADKFSMRKLADKVGVSRSALYHHFQDKNHLLCDIACMGFETLNEIMKGIQVDPSSTDFINAKAKIIAYVQFARENPEQYNLMFGGTIWKSGEKPTEKLRKLSAKTFKTYARVLSAKSNQSTISTNAATVKADDPTNPNKALSEDKTKALRLYQLSWATLHGLCRFVIDGIYTDENVVNEMLDYATALVLKSSLDESKSIKL